MLNAVMIVDDSESDRYIVKRVLERAQVAKKILQFPSGYEALEYFDDRDRFAAETGPWPPPVLILLDINMPRLDGFEFLAELRSRIAAGTIPSGWATVMMLTSSGDDRDRERAGEFDQVIDYIVKPLTVEAAQRIANKAAETATTQPCRN